MVLNFVGYPNKSLSIGDSICFVNNLTNFGDSTVASTIYNSTSDTSGSSNITTFGTITEIINTNGGFKIIADQDGYTLPQNSDFIFFYKNNIVELSSVVGYYNNITLSNNSTTKAELFAVSSDISESSK